MAFYRYLLILVICNFPVAVANGKTITVTGQLSNDTNVVTCVGDERISTVILKCDEENEILHIINFEMSFNPQCNASAEAGGCKLSTVWYFPNVMSPCEGSTGSCQFNVDNQTYCNSVNHIDITIRCINPDTVYQMCPESGYSKPDLAAPVVLATQNFILPNDVGGYSPSIKCSCAVTPLNDSRIYVQALFMHIEHKVKGAANCTHDLLSVGGEYCRFYDLVEGRDNLPFFELGKPVKFEFLSNADVERRGAWFKISTDEGSTFDLACYAIQNRTFLASTKAATTTTKSTTATTKAGTTTTKAATTTTKSTTTTTKATTTTTKAAPTPTKTATTTTKATTTPTKAATTTTKATTTPIKAVTSTTTTTETTIKDVLIESITEADNSQKPLSVGAGIGVGVGVLVFVAAVTVTYCFYLRSGQQRTRRNVLAEEYGFQHNRLYDEPSSHSLSSSGQTAYFGNSVYETALDNGSHLDLGIQQP